MEASKKRRVRFSPNTQFLCERTFTNPLQSVLQLCSLCKIYYCTYLNQCSVLFCSVLFNFHFCSIFTPVQCSVLFNFQFRSIFNPVQCSVLLHFQFCWIVTPFQCSVLFNFQFCSILLNYTPFNVLCCSIFNFVQFYWI